MKPEEITVLIEKELGSHSERFSLIDLTVPQARQPHGKSDRPGVYIFWKNSQVIKVGRHLTNVRKRSLEHIRDNTGNKMAALKDDNECHILLYTLEPSDDHWAATLEMFLEKKLNPAIKSNRR